MKRTLLVGTLVLAALMIAAAPAYGAVLPETTSYTTADECYVCHQGTGAAVTRADFSVAGKVNYTKCNACHAGLRGLNHYHFTSKGIDNCVSCHNGTNRFLLNLPPDATVTVGYPPVTTAYGYFTSSDSLSATPAELHDIHASSNWVERAYGDTKFGRFPIITCSPCHAPAACSACHDAPPTSHSDHAVSQYPAVISKQATGGTTGVSYAPSTCINPACHDLAKAGTSAFTPDCGSCHAEKTVAHGYADIDHVANDGEAEGIACSACHSLDLASVHGDPGAWGASCATCHPTPRDSLGAWDQSCATGGCHTATSTAPMHADTATAHAVAPSNELCLDCHTGDDLGSIHAEAEVEETGKTSCFVCHTGVTGEPATNDCTNCHFTYDEHYAGADGTRHISSWALFPSCAGAGCHDASGDLMAVHVEKDSTFTCDGCHKDFSVALQIDEGLTGCGDCHDNIYETSGHRAAHPAVPPLTPAAYAYDVDGGVGVPVNDCIGCHQSNLVDEHMGKADQYGVISSLPRFTIAGDALTCASCHSSSDANVIAAIKAGNTACTGCHDIHKQVTKAHTSTFATDPQVDCAACHESQLDSEHNGSFSITTPAGTVLAGCAICHDYWTTEGELGVLVQAAIEGKNQTQCSACHAPEHRDLGSHTVSAPASQECAVCHHEGGTTSIDVKAIHAGADLGACAVCHANAGRVGDISLLNAECTSCHATEGSTYHRALPGAHTYGAMDASCLGSSCHAANTLPEEHERFLADTGYATTCAMCHQNADPLRIDWTEATAACDTCHAVHGDIDELHTAVGSDACVRCHDSADLRVLHGETVDASCATCHNASFDTTGKTAECTTCHNATVSPFHETMGDAHTFTLMETGCQQAGCHVKTLPEEHAKYKSRYPTYADTCALCHLNTTLNRIDWTTASADCSKCHTVHGNIDELHVSTSSQACVDCHKTGDVLDLHLKTDGTGDTDCAMCHAAPAERIDWAAVRDAADGVACVGCHAGVGTGHRDLHEAASVNPKGCSGCHFMNLVDEHEALGFTCDTCHKSTVSTVVSTIAADDLRCKSCHPGAHGNHSWEFNPGRASLHRTSADLPGMRSSFVVNGTTYTWSLPSASTFLKTGWTTSSMMECSDCHSYSGATGPHGATMKVNIDPAYPNPYRVTTGSESSTAQLSKNSSTGMSMTKSGSANAKMICEKCHDLVNGSTWSNVVHKEHDDRGRNGAYCNSCHIGVPHGWSRPRMIGYTTDPAPYATYTGGVQRMTLKSYTPSNWQKSDCGAACSSSRHPISGSSWPATDVAPPAPTTGTVSGTVKDSATNAAIAGATVTVGTKTATTSSTGAYSVADVTAGSYAMSVTAAGYNAWSGSVSVTSGATTTQDVALTLTPIAPSATNIARTGTASASSTNSSDYASRAIDGNTSSYWRSSSGGTQWLRVDLGSTKTFDKVVVNWDGSRYAKAYRIETSNDGSSWTSRYSTSSGRGGTETITFSPVSARYVRIYMTTTNDSHYRINEFEIWGY